MKIKALAYTRTSSMANAGPEGDSEPRQRQAIQAFADRSGFQVISWYGDVQSGADALETRSGFMALLDHIEGNGVRHVILEDPSRFARDLMTQELGVLMLQKRGVTLMTANGENLTQTDDPMKNAMRQMAGVFSQLEKSRVVAKLKHGRDKVRQKTGRCEGARPMAKRYPKATRRALALYNVQDRPTLQQIADVLTAEGHVSITKTVSVPTAQGTKRRVASIKRSPFTAMAVWRMVKSAA